jgi:hypothetical protein
VEEQYTKGPLETLGELPPVTVNRREGKQVNRSPLAHHHLAALATHGPLRNKGKRSKSISGTKSPGSKSPPIKKTDEGGEGAEGVREVAVK